MTSDTITSFWQRWADRLTKPNPGIKSVQDRQQARLLSTLLLTLLLIFAALASLWLINSPSFTQAPDLVVGGLLTFVAAYAISRTRYYTGGAVLFILTLLVLVLLIILYSPGPLVMRMLSLKAFIVAIMLSILFLKRRVTVLLFSLCLALITSFFWSGVPFAYTYSYLAVFVIVSGLAVVNWAVWHRYKQELLASEERYAALFEQSHDAVFLLDLQSRHIAANRRAAEMLGYSLEEMQALSVEEISAEKAASMNVLEKLLAGEHVPIYERLFRRKDGSVVPVEIKVELVRDEEGNSRHIQSVVRDITERKAWEQELRLHSAALNASANAMIITDRDGTIQWCNLAYLELTGYTAVEITDKNPRDLVKSGLHEQPFYKEMWDTILAGKIWQGKIINRRKDGTLYTEEQTITPVKDDYGSVTHFIAVKYDVTDREKDAQALRQSEARQRALLDAMPDLMFRAHRDGTYLDYHAPNSNQLLLTPDQFLGHKITDVLPPDLAQTSMHYIDQTLRTGKLVRFEYSVMLDGRPLHFEARMIPAGPDEILTIVRDITRQRKLQDQALELALEKERADLLRQFVQNASHELRTPLTSINTNLYLISNVIDEEKRQAYIERSQKQIMRLTHLIDMILSMTRLDSGIPFLFEKTDMNDLVAQLVSGLEGIFSEKGGVIQFTPDPMLPTWRVDKGWLQQALRHLLDNAIRFSPNGGLIALRTYMQAGEVVVEISDSGVGISEQALPRVFERFWRQDEARTTPGFGLGLSIAQKIAENHNGRIEVESEVGQGSQFRILLPHHANSDS